MKIVTKPTVKIVSTPNFHEPDDRKVPTDGDEITRLGAFAAKGCYGTHGRDGRPCEKNQKAILEHKHGSVLEHLNIGVWIEGITRALSLELNRHRHFAISQRSTRYTDEEDATIVLEPYFARLYEDWGDPRNENNRFYGKTDDVAEVRALSEHLDASEQAIRSYASQVRSLMDRNPHDMEPGSRDLRKWARGKARNVLPHNLETKGTWTTNIRAWRWIIEARSNRHAADEIRRLAGYFWRILYYEVPRYFEDFRVNEVVRGIPELVPEHSKV